MKLNEREALIAGVLTKGEFTVSEISERIESDPKTDLNPGVIYNTLKKMEVKGNVKCERIPLTTADGKIKEIGHYSLRDRAGH